MTVRRFLSDTRAGATAIAAVAMATVALGAVALVGDHMSLVGQRDVLKTAADAAAVAATLKLSELPASMTDDDVDGALQPVAERYVSVNVLGNLPEGVRARARDTLRVTVAADRALGTVEVVARADLGGTPIAKRFFGHAGPEDGIRQRAGVEAAMATTELVLALDATGSMMTQMSGGVSRLQVVRKAALDLVDVLAVNRDGGAAPLAVGLVPWHHIVQLGQETRRTWERRGWAVYPDEHHYPFPRRIAGQYGCSPTGRFPCTLPGETVTMPEKPAAWQGCVDQRSFDGADPPPALSAALPGDAPFNMRFYSPQVLYPLSNPVSYECSTADEGAQKYCYSGTPTQNNQYLLRRAQGQCRADDDLAIVPLTPDLSRIRSALRELSAPGGATYSTLGVVWGTRLLTSSWREVWGGERHPIDPTGGEEVRKVLVLLTDGQDNYWDRAAVADHRNRACTQAKAAGILVFAIAALNDDHPGHDRLAEELERCSSQADDPTGRYVFVNNATREDLADAFRWIGRQLLTLRRVH